MNSLLKNLSSMRGSTYEELIKYVSDYLTNNSNDICEIASKCLAIEDSEKRSKFIKVTCRKIEKIKLKESEPKVKKRNQTNWNLNLKQMKMKKI